MGICGLYNGIIWFHIAFQVTFKFVCLDALFYRILVRSSKYIGLRNFQTEEQLKLQQPKTFLF